VRRLEGKAALITGGGAGIGAATAELFTAEGARVLLVDSDAAALETTSLRIGANVVTFTADVADAPLAAEAVRRAVAAFGHLDVLVNNASMRSYAPLADAAAADWEAVVNVNLVGAASACRAALPALRANGCGAIVNVSSCYAVTGRKGMGIYDATKAGLLALTRTLAFEEAAHGVRANAVCPGSTLTDFHVKRAAAAGKDLAQLRTEREETSLLARWADPREIAFPILWLASDEASFVTGATLMVDGGLSIK
jgi:meso-butanediol dehydrogenase/(S,S)-butanediol dehydrogenase/diacetyl reductase